MPKNKQKIIHGDLTISVDIWLPSDQQISITQHEAYHSKPREGEFVADFMLLDAKVTKWLLATKLPNDERNKDKISFQIRAYFDYTLTIPGSKRPQFISRILAVRADWCLEAPEIDNIKFGRAYRDIANAVMMDFLKRLRHA